MNEGNTTNVGRLTILPSSHAGSPRHMHEYAQDTIAYFRLYGCPDLLLHLHVINLGTRYGSFYFKDNRRFIDTTLRPVSSGKS